MSSFKSHGFINASSLIAFMSYVVSGSVIVYVRIAGKRGTVYAHVVDCIIAHVVVSVHNAEHGEY